MNEPNNTEYATLRTEPEEIRHLPFSNTRRINWTAVVAYLSSGAVSIWVLLKASGML